MATLAGSTTLVTANATSVTSGSLTTTAGDILVVKYVQEDNTGTTSITGGGLTWTSRAVVQLASNCRVQIWTATATGGSVSATVTKTTSARRISVVLERWTAAKLATTPAVVQTNGTGAPSATITTAAANSYVSWACGDWAAVNGSSRAYRSSATEDGYDFQSTVYTAYDATQSAPTAGAQTVGLTAPTGQTWAIAGVEIQDAGGTSATPTPGSVAGVATVPTPTLTAQGNTTVAPAVVAGVAAVPAPTIGTGSNPATFVASSTSGLDTQATSQTTAKPAGTVAGDLVLLHYTRWISGATAGSAITPPTGAVRIGSQVTVQPTAAGNRIITDIFAIIAGAETNYTVTTATSEWSHLDAQAWHGASTSSLATIVSANVTGAGTAITSVSAASGTGDGAAYFVNTMEYGTGLAHTPPTGFTETQDNEPEESAYKNSLTSGTTAASGATLSASSDYIAFLVIVPASSGGSTPVNATATPVSVTGTASVPGPSIQTAGNASVGAASISRLASVPAPAVTATSTPTPATVLAPVAMDTMAGAISTAVDVAAVAGVAAVPAASVVTSGNATPAPATISRLVVVGAAAVSGSALASPATAAGAASVPGPTVTATSTATPAPTSVAGATAVPAPVLTATSRPTPPVVTGAIVMPAPIVATGSSATAQPAVVSGAGAVPAPTLKATSTPAPASVAGVVFVPAAAITATARPTPASVAGAVVVGVPVFHLSALADATTVLGGVSVGVVVISGASGPTASFYLWNGTTTVPLAVTLWNGTSEVPASFSSVV